MLKTYSAKKVLISFGTHAVTGYAEDSFVSIEKNGDGTMKKVGCDGEVVRAIDPDKSYRITLTVLQTSPTSAWLQNMFNMDQETGNALFPVTVKDLMGGTLFTAEFGWVGKPSTRGYGRDTTSREWTIDTAEADLKDEVAA
jgi:hypothetical protein